MHSILDILDILKTSHLFVHFVCIAEQMSNNLQILCTVMKVLSPYWKFGHTIGTHHYAYSYTRTCDLISSSDHTTTVFFVLSRNVPAHRLTRLNYCVLSVCVCTVPWLVSHPGCIQGVTTPSVPGIGSGTITTLGRIKWLLKMNHLYTISPLAIFTVLSKSIGTASPIL